MKVGEMLFYLIRMPRRGNPFVETKPIKNIARQLAGSPWTGITYDKKSH